MHTPISGPSLIAASLCASLFIAAMPVPAYADFLSPDEAKRLLFDGRPWTAVTADGKPAKLTLNKDGTGSFEGPFTVSVKWDVRGSEICLHISIAGTKCVRFRPVANGYAGYSGSTLDLTLTR